MYGNLHIEILDLQAPSNAERSNDRSCLADIADFLLASQHRQGGVGGSPGQIGHLATTYAGVASAVTAGQEVLAVLDRQAIFQFLQDRAVAPSAGGGFAVCQGEQSHLIWLSLLARFHRMNYANHTSLLAAKTSDARQLKDNCQLVKGLPDLDRAGRISVRQYRVTLSRYLKCAHKAPADALCWPKRSCSTVCLIGPKRLICRRRGRC